MDWHFLTLVKKLGLRVGAIEQAPNTTGYYRLFNKDGKFIYVGSTADLRQRLIDHFGPNEKNKWIRGVARYAIWELTWNLDGAKEAERFLYDVWVAMNGRPPSANKIKPPKSKLSRRGLSSNRNFNSRFQRRRSGSALQRLQRRYACHNDWCAAGSLITAKPRRWSVPPVLHWRT